jgi:peptidoglycan/LPS O-acetylase OafA/YrhL
MNFLHLHIAINHSPLYAELFALVLLIAGLWRRNNTLARFGLALAVVAALSGFVTKWSGDEADETIDHSPPIAGVDKKLIDPHQDAAGYFVTAAYITGGLAIISLIVGWRRGARPVWLDWLIVAAIALSFVIAARTALLGGRIHHPEVRAALHYWCTRFC